MIKIFFAHYEAPPISVASVTAIKKNWKPHIDAVGNFVAINGVEVNSEAAGNVSKIHFDSGQYIQAGMPLIDIDDSVDLAVLSFNEADKTLKELNYKRQTDLYKRGATPSSNVDEAKANLQQAEATVQKTQAQIKQKHLTAPFSGQLGIRQVNLGQYITPGQTSVVTLQSLDPLYLEFSLPEQRFKDLFIGQPIQFHIDGFNNLIFEGKISAINAKADANTHTILVQASLPNCPDSAIKDNQSPLVTRKKEPDGSKTIITCDTTLNQNKKIDHFAFIPGMFTAIAIEQAPIPNVIVLPSTAISYSLYGNSVFVIEKQDKKDKEGHPILTVKRVFVETGEVEGNYVVIKKGITDGQEVVSAGELKLQNGTRVIINNSIPLPDTMDPETIGQ